jgi:hypothetical protein
MNLAVAGEDGNRTRNESGVDVTLEQLSHPSQPFQREATSSHLSHPHFEHPRLTGRATSAHDCADVRKTQSEKIPLIGWIRTTLPVVLPGCSGSTGGHEVSGVPVE